MKNFIGIFLASFFVCIIAAFVFVNFLGDIWTLIIFAAFLLAVFITIYLNQESRMDKIEEKIEQLLKGEDLSQNIKKSE